jgi:hypothetical protein
MTTALDPVVDPVIDPAADPAPSTTPTPEPVAQDPAPAPNDPPPATAADSWGEDWRQKIAGDDEKWMKQLDRYSTPQAMAEALRNAQEKIRSGQAKSLPDNPTDEQMAEWREQQGIPESFDKYDLKLEDGLIIGDDDKPMVDAFLEAMHGKNATPDQVNAGLNAYYKMQEAQIQQIEQQDNTDKETALQSLRDEWGPDFQSNRNALMSLMNGIPEAAKEMFMNARLADGTAMLNSPDLLMWMADLSRKTNPAATVVPNSNNPSQAINDELKQLNGWMATGDKRYWKDEGAQARWRQLTEAQENMK